MNKKTSMAIIIVLSILIVTGSYTITHCLFNYSTTEWFQEQCDTGYIIIR